VIHFIFPAALIGVVWVLVTSRVTLESYFVGLMIGLAITALMPPPLPVIRWRRLPDQAFALVLYAMILLRDIVLSGLDVTRRILSPTMPLNLGIIAVETQDETANPLIAALSADVITLTPGELVIEVTDGHTLYVHCLDVEASAARAAAQQAQRLKLFKRILGRSS